MIEKTSENTSSLINDFGKLELFENGFKMTFSEYGLKITNVLLITFLLTVGTYYLLQLLIYLGIRIFNLVEESYKEYKLALKKESMVNKKINSIESTMLKNDDKTIDVAPKKPGRKKKVLT